MVSQLNWKRMSALLSKDECLYIGLYELDSAFYF